VVLLPSGSASRLYLPFLLRTTELYLIEPGGESAVRELLKSAPRLGEERVGGEVLRRVEYLGRRAVVVTGTGAPRR
jgi:hypothetical protein